tara:strand:- start:1060 stop:1722 length:663 start_codon:yes stop_codon:yes gene_type:complete
MSELTLIIPSKHESESLPVFLKEIEKYDYCKLVVLQKEDLETKKSISNIKNIEILEQKSNGYGSALKEGIEAAKTKYCCIINADGSMDPKYLKIMLELCKERDFVFASRYSVGGGSDDDNIVTFIGNKFFSFIGRFFFKLQISDILFTYILGKTDTFKALNLTYSDFRICVEIPIYVKKKNYRYTSISSYERSRIGGKKKVNAIRDGVLILLAMIILFFK